MGIRILQLSLNNSRFSLMAETGIKIPKFQNLFFDFARLEVGKKYNEENVVVNTASDYKVVEIDENFKIITLSIAEQEVDEEKIMFIVKHAIKIVVSEKIEKIAGRDDFQEGIFLLKEGDSITVTMACEKATFTAARVNKKLYLVKEYPEYL